MSLRHRCLCAFRRPRRSRSGRETGRFPVRSAYLHGEYGRRERASQRAGLIEEHAVWEWTDGLERLIYVFEEDIIRLQDDGTINLS